MSRLRDERNGAYDPVTDEGRPQPDRVPEKRTPRQDAQPGADVRSQVSPSGLPVLPEGLRRKPKGPYGRKSGRS
jgi:hypothetical protein